MKVHGRIFLVDDDELIVSMLSRALKNEGYETQIQTTAEDILNKISLWHPDVVLLDIELGDPDRNGIDILEEIKNEKVDTEVIMITGDDSADSAIKAMKLGAADYLTKPFNIDEVKIVVRNILEKERLKEQVDYLRKSRSTYCESEPIGKSAIIREIHEKAERLAKAHVDTILITGESGTGKEVVARYIHNMQNMDQEEDYAPFIAVNCTALPDHLFESELFGYTKGAFTDAKSDQKGMFELANGGTILLDEIGDMQPNLQSKLLRVLEERKVRRIGGKVDLPLAVTVIATTNRDLKQAVEDGDFRMDLFYRLNTFAFHIPPLRERKEDIPLFVKHFMAMFSKKYLKTGFTDLSPEAEKVLSAYDWPGNIRELKNVIERVVVLENTDIIMPEHLPAGLVGRPFVERRKSDRFVLPEGGISLESLEKDLIEQALTLADNNQTKAAKLLNISYDALRYQIKKFGLR